MRFVARAAALLGGLAMAAGCAVLAGLPGDYSLAADGGAGGDGGTLDGPVARDGGPDVLSPPLDAAGDVAVSLDAGTDAPAVLCGVSYCPCDAGYFCSDFDETDPLAPWTGQTVDPGCTVGADNVDFVSAPDSVLTTLGVDGGGHARLDYRTPVPAIPNDLLFKEYVHTLNSPTATGSITLIQIDAAGAACNLQLEARVDGYHLNLYGANCGTTGLGDHQVPNSPPFGQWSQVEIDFTNGAPGALAIQFPGTGAVFKTPFTINAAQDVAIHVGPADTSPLEVRYDNVELHLQ